MKSTIAVPEGGAVVEAMRQVAPLRGLCYGWLAACFKAPVTGELLALLREPAVAGAVAAVAGTEVSMDLAAALPDADLDALRWDYNNLFLVPAGQYLTPYESVYRGRYEDERGKAHLGGLNGPETLEVARFYRAWGVELAPSRPLLPDFAGAELELLRLLVEREEQAWERGDTVAARRLLGGERSFLLDHVARWLPELCDNMAVLAGQPLHVAAARFTRAFLAMEEATFRDLPPLATEDAAEAVR